jgi:hypothetical protein
MLQLVLKRESIQAARHLSQSVPSQNKIERRRYPPAPNRSKSCYKNYGLPKCQVPFSLEIIPSITGTCMPNDVDRIDCLDST